MSVRYIHDILKVDVIVDRELVRQIREDVTAGNLRADDYLTARFEIPAFLVTSEARQGDEPCDLFAERLEVDQPLCFYRDGQNIHSLRPVTADILDENTLQIINPKIDDFRGIVTAQLWQLSRDGTGVAEMSVSLGDLADAPEGDLLIDPSTYFQELVSGYTGCEDAYMLIDQNSTPDKTAFNYGASTTLGLWAVKPAVGNHFEARPIIRFKGLDKLYGSENPWLPVGTIVTSASLALTLDSRTISYGSTPPDSYWVQPYGITDAKDDWVEGSGNGQQASNNEVTWSHARYNSKAWSQAGAAQIRYDRTGAVGDGVNIASYQTAGDVVHWPLNSYVVQDWLERCRLSQNVAGLILEVTTRQTAYSNVLQYNWRSRNFATSGSRPKLIINYRRGTEYGADSGNGTQPSATQEFFQDRMLEDNIKVIRFFAQDDRTYLEQVVVQARDEMKVIPVFPVGSSNTPTAYKDMVMYRLNYITNDIGINKTVPAIELGNEEDGNLKFGYDTDNSATRYNSGMSFGEYYLAARGAIKANWPDVEIIGGGSPSVPTTLETTPPEKLK